MVIMTELGFFCLANNSIVSLFMDKIQLVFAKNPYTVG